MDTDSYREKRIAPRHSADLRCWVGDGELERYARVVDLNEYGVRVETSAPPKVGSPLKLRFKLPPVGAPVEAEAEVMWRSEGYDGRAGVMGLRFTRVLGREAIQAYSDRLETGVALDD